MWGPAPCILINGADGGPMAFFCQSRKTCSLHKLKVISSRGPHRHCGGQPTRILLSQAHGESVVYFRQSSSALYGRKTVAGHRGSNREKYLGAGPLSPAGGPREISLKGTPVLFLSMDPWWVSDFFARAVSTRWSPGGPPKLNWLK